MARIGGFKALTCANVGAPEGIRTPNLLIRSFARGVHTGPSQCICTGQRLVSVHSGPLESTVVRPLGCKVGCTSGATRG